MDKLHWFTATKLFDGKHILADENDPESIFIAAECAMTEFFVSNGVSKDDIEGHRTCLLINTRNGMQPYNFSFLSLMKKTNYRGIGSSKLFRCTPTNALASYLSIKFHIQGPVITFIGKQGNMKNLEEYCEFLKHIGKIDCGIIMLFNIRYPKHNLLEVFELIKQNHINDLNYLAEINISLVR